MLPAQHRLSGADEFRLAVRTGNRAGGRLLVVHAVSTSDPGPARVGLVVSRAVGPAVVRTRVKRRLRHLVREHVTVLPAGALVVLRAQPAAATASYDGLERELARGLRRTGMLQASVPA